MFQISTLEDKAVRILPANLALSQLEAITQQLEATYVDKARGAAAARRSGCSAQRLRRAALRAAASRQGPCARSAPAWPAGGCQR
jgi:hypothetical protein